VQGVFKGDREKIAITRFHSTINPRVAQRTVSYLFQKANGKEGMTTMSWGGENISPENHHFEKGKGWGALDPLCSWLVQEREG